MQLWKSKALQRISLESVGQKNYFLDNSVKNQRIHQCL